MSTYSIGAAAGRVPRILAHTIAIAATTAVLFIVAAALPGGTSGGGVWSAATSSVVPSDAHAFLRLPSGFSRWLEFQSRKQRPYCIGDPCADQPLA